MSGVLKIVLALFFSVAVMAGGQSLVFAATATSGFDEACAVTPGMSQDQIDSIKSNPACTATNDNPVTGPGGIVTTISNLVAYFAGGIAVIMIIFGAFRIVKSSGDSGKITQARETIIYALIGLVVIILARLIVGLVISKL